jgi:AraC-like DNA-binding protein
MATTGFMPATEAWEKSSQLTNKALLLNDQLPGVHYQLAQLSFFTACDYRESFKQATKAIELKPNYVEAQRFLSFLHIIAGEKEKALEHLEISLGIDPLSQETQFFSAYFHYILEDYSTALEKLDRCLKYDPKNIPAHSVKCYCLLKLGRCDEVIHYFDTLPSGIVAPGDKLGLTTLAYAVKKDSANTAHYLAQLLEHVKGKDAFRGHSYLFLTYAVMGQKDKAFEWIRQSIENKSSLLLFNFVDPLVNSLKDDPRYLAFQKKIYQKDSITENTRKKKELLESGTVVTYTTRLLQYINEKKPYLDPNLSLRSLAQQINIHPNQLSWLLNESMRKNFNEFINHYRVDAFKMLASDPKNSRLTLIELAHDSGFNSKTVFDTYVKKETGLSPKKFLELRN